MQQIPPGFVQVNNVESIVPDQIIIAANKFNNNLKYKGNVEGTNREIIVLRLTEAADGFEEGNIVGARISDFTFYRFEPNLVGGRRRLRSKSKKNRKSRKSRKFRKSKKTIRKH